MGLGTDGVGTECGIFGVYLFDEKKYSSFDLANIGLRQLQHRGEMSSGFATFSDDFPEGYIRRTIRPGRIEEGFSKMGNSSTVYNKSRTSLGGKFTIGHVRYATSGTGNNTTMDEILIEATGQPRFREHIRRFKEHAFCWNGNISNVFEIERGIAADWENYKKKAFNDTVLFDIVFSQFVATIEQSLDTEDFTKMFSYITDDLDFQGSFNLLYMDANGNLVAARDPLGLKPMVYHIEPEVGVFISSETIGIEKVIDSLHGNLRSDPKSFKSLHPGHILHIVENNVEGPLPYTSNIPKQMRDIFEFIYFARAESWIDGRSVRDARYDLGVELSMTEKNEEIVFQGMKDNPDDYVIICVPKTPFPIVKGYCEKLSGLTGNYFAQEDVLLLDNEGRTFTDNDAATRADKVRAKFSTIKHLVRGKKVIVIDDSIVRGNTSKEINDMLREAGAQEVHMRSAAAQIPYCCYDGAIDMPYPQDQVSYNRNPHEVNEFIGADSTLFNSVDSMIRAVAGNILPLDSFCTGCFDGRYCTVAAQRRLQQEIEKTH